MMGGNKIYVQGSYIDVHDNENVYLNVDKANVNVGDNGQMQQEQQKNADEDILSRLSPIFYGLRDEARKFLEEIHSMKPTHITARVNKLVDAKTISDKSHKHDLWKVLHDAGLYKPTESNWNQQVK